MSKGYKRIPAQTRRNYLNYIIKSKGSLDCACCNQTDLIINSHGEADIPDYRKATVDHIRCMALGGEKSNRNNWQVLCSKCNTLKSIEESKLINYWNKKGFK